MENNKELLEATVKGLQEKIQSLQTDLNQKQKELEDAHLEYIKLERDLDRLQGSIQAIEYCAYGKLPHDGNHGGMKDHKPVKHNDLGSLD